VTVDDGIRKQAGVHHLDQIFVLKILIDRHDGNRLQALGHERVAEPSEMARIGMVREQIGVRSLNGFPDFSVMK
jgi:hypothetical protein